ncbi:MAG: FAD-dependent oxidoreductase [Candidatus Omnitrophica bacterium]|nr:FAD-dependent oxidoreductase [Candidatus Omnitrophota bacterium]
MMAQEVRAIVQEVIKRTHNVKSIRLEPAGDLNFKAGQFLSVRLKAEKELKRYLSFSSSPSEGFIEFTKKLTESDFSRTLDGLKSKDEVFIQYPFGDFTLKDDHKKVAFLSGGIGITPIRSICKFATDKKLDVDIALLYANRTFSDIAFRQDFDLMKKENPRLKVVHVLSEACPDFESCMGRIDSGLIKKEVPDYSGRKFFLCGPPAMVDAMKKILSEELVLPKDSIITENFQGY